MAGLGTLSVPARARSVQSLPFSFWRFQAQTHFDLVRAATPAADDPRIVGGDVVDSISQYPFIVSVQFKPGSHACGGSVLSKHVVVTAGHCGVFDPASMQVVVGRRDLTDKTVGAVIGCVLLWLA